MLDAQTWIVFITSALALAFAPGPGILYVLSRTISGGRSAGISSTIGSASGGMVHVFAAALGVSTLLASSAIAFSIVKYLGAAFLVYLGVTMVISAIRTNKLETIPQEPQQKTNVTFSSLFYQGAISEILNPKTAIFFLAFIPQFVQIETGNIFSQFLLLGTIVVILNTLPDFLICFFSKPIEQLWKTSLRFRKTQETISGACLIGLGIYVATSNTGDNTINNIQSDRQSATGF
jgi:threonine/homoserine/homoserine lactone efflux protein